MKLKGTEAIEYAETNGLLLNKFTDPTEGERDDLTTEEAHEVARDDANLIWVDTEGHDKYTITSEEYDAGMTALAASLPRLNF